MKKILTVIAMTTFLASATAVPVFASNSSDAQQVYNTLAVAKNDAGQATPVNDSNLKSLAQSRANSLAKQDKAISKATVDNGLTTALRGKGYGVTYQLKGRGEQGAASIADSFVSTQRATVRSSKYNALGVGSATSKTGYTYVIALYADYKKPVVATPKPAPKPIAPKPAPKPKPVVKPKPAAPKPTTKPAAPAPKPSTPTTKPSTPKPAAKPKPAAPNPAEAAKLKAAEEKAAKAEAAVKEQEKKAEADAEQRRTDAAKGKLESDQAIADAAELARVADTARIEKEQQIEHVKSVIRDIVGYTGNGSIGLGLLLLAASAIIRKKPLLELPRWTKADLDFDFDD